MFSIKNKVVVVTGGSGLLGKEIVKSLRANGAIAISADISFEDDSEFNLEFDITNESNVVNGIKSVINKYGKIDGWVNNAYPRTKDWGLKIEDIPFDSWRKNVDMHLNGYFLCCQKVLEHMKTQRFGSLINMSSIYGLIGPDFSVYAETNMTMPAAYSAIKGGINTLTRYLAACYGTFQIRVNAISPGGIFDNQPESFIQRYSNKVPLKRMGCPDDIVSAVIFLLCDNSAYITGHNLVVDGGWSII